MVAVVSKKMTSLRMHKEEYHKRLIRGEADEMNRKVDCKDKAMLIEKRSIFSKKRILLVEQRSQEMIVSTVTRLNKDQIIQIGKLSRMGTVQTMRCTSNVGSIDYL